ncbi:MAG: substrate-binding domain-containing protein [Opitutaceae bacterium]|nr:substrate-binding domain-containing protein [Opitutaceae bacterium]
MPAEIFNYHSLAAQVAARIAHDIGNGTWVNSLPSERTLAELLRVSRKTVRKSIAQLQRDGVIKTSHRLGHRIVGPAAPAARPDQSIGLLTPEALDQMPSRTALWVDELRALLFERGIRLTAFSSCRFFSRGAGEALRRLVAQNPQTCWVLTHSTESLQRWFYERGIPCIVAGSGHHGVPLPNIDLDYFAVCRHAVGAMLRHGHRRLAFFVQQSQRGGDLESEAGFLDGVQRSGHPEVESVVTRHDGTVEGAWRMLSRLFDSPSPPTALLIAKPAFYLTAITFLADRGLRVGEQVSLISRDHDSFLSYLRPSPAGYMVSPRTYAKRLFPLVLAYTRNQPIAQPGQRIEPKFVPGGSRAAQPRPRPSAPQGERTALLQEGLGELAQAVVHHAHVAARADELGAERPDLLVMFAPDADRAEELLVSPAGFREQLHRANDLGMREPPELPDPVRIVARTEEQPVHAGHRHDLVEPGHGLGRLDLADDGHLVVGVPHVVAGREGAVARVRPAAVPAAQAGGLARRGIRVVELRPAHDLPGLLRALHHGAHDATHPRLHDPHHRLVVQGLEARDRRDRVGPGHHVHHRQVPRGDVEMLEVEPDRLELACPAHVVDMPRRREVAEAVQVLDLARAHAGQQLVGTKGRRLTHSGAIRAAVGRRDNPPLLASDGGQERGVVSGAESEIQKARIREATAFLVFIFARASAGIRLPHPVNLPSWRA